MRARETVGMAMLRQKVGPAVAVLSGVVTVGSLILDGADAATLGLPYWTWEAIGATVFFALVIALLYGHERDMEKRLADSGFVSREDVPRIIKEKLEVKIGPPVPLEEAARAKNEPSPTTLSVSPSATDSMAAFDPNTIITELGGVDLSGLSEPESFMTITLNVRNVSGYRVTITGVKGQIQCAGARCTSPATVNREPRKLSTSSHDRVPCTIMQPLGSGMMNKIATAGDLPISLLDLTWVGSVALPQGSVLLDLCHIQESFVVKGPYKEELGVLSLFRLRTTFLSSEHYNSDGTPKRDD